MVVLDSFPPDEALQAIAAENNLAETAFVVASGDGYRLRWFTPTLEVPLCGHATLASAAVVMERLEPGRREVVFESGHSGSLPVRRTDGGYVMDFPARPSRQMADPPAGLATALGVAPAEVHVNEFNYLAVLDDAATVRGLVPDIAAVAALDRPGVIVTAEGGNEYDFVSPGNPVRLLSIRERP